MAVKKKKVAKKKVAKKKADLNSMADSLYQLKLDRSEANSVVRELDDKIKKLKQQALDLLIKNKTTVAGGKLGTVEVKPKDVPIVEDREALQQHIIDTGDFDLLRGALSEPAVRERWEEGVAIPGIGVYKTETLSIKKK